LLEGHIVGFSDHHHHHHCKIDGQEIAKTTTTPAQFHEVLGLPLPHIFWTNVLIGKVNLISQA